MILHETVLRSVAGEELPTPDWRDRIGRTPKNSKERTP